MWPKTDGIASLPEVQIRSSLPWMKMVTKKEAVEAFDLFGGLAHAGETVVVTHAGKPWIKLVPAAQPKRGKSAAAFKIRLNRISTKPIPGVTEVLNRLRR